MKRVPPSTAYENARRSSPWLRSSLNPVSELSNPDAPPAVAIERAGALAMEGTDGAARARAAERRRAEASIMSVRRVWGAAMAGVGGERWGLAVGAV
jgi:hypothetical protein